jgi:hypothetical protein
MFKGFWKRFKKEADKELEVKEVTISAGAVQTKLTPKEEKPQIVRATFEDVKRYDPKRRELDEYVVHERRCGTYHLEAGNYERPFILTVIYIVIAVTAIVGAWFLIFADVASVPGWALLIYGVSWLTYIFYAVRRWLKAISFLGIIFSMGALLGWAIWGI